MIDIYNINEVVELIAVDSLDINLNITDFQTFTSNSPISDGNNSTAPSGTG